MPIQFNQIARQAKPLTWAMHNEHGSALIKVAGLCMPILSETKIEKPLLKRLMMGLESLWNYSDHVLEQVCGRTLLSAHRGTPVTVVEAWGRHAVVLEWLPTPPTMSDLPIYNITEDIQRRLFKGFNT